MFRFDKDSFVTWFKITAKYPKKDIELYIIDAQRIMLMCTRDGITPQYKLPKDCTKSGLDKYYVQLANRKSTAIMDKHQPGYDHFIHSVDGFAYFKTSLEASIFGMELVKEFEACGWMDEIELIDQGKITGNVVAMFGNSLT